MSGSIIVSIVLGLPTVGPLLVDSLISQDMFLAGTIVLLLGVLTVIGTLHFGSGADVGRSAPARPVGLTHAISAALGRRRAVDAAERFAVATQLQLTWWRFKRHRLAMVERRRVMLFYLLALFADFLATTDPHATNAATSYISPQPIHLFDNGAFHPYVYGLKGVRNPKTFKLVYTPDPNRKVYLELFAHGYPYSFLGIPTDHSSVRPEGPAARRRHLPVRHRSARPRSVVAADGGDPRSH